MYNSLFNYCKEFQLFIFAMDEDCYNALRKLGLKNVKVIELSSFENKDLLIVKSQRTAREYLWTCASASIKYVLDTFQVEACTYIDSDLLFFSDPSPLLDEMQAASVLITEHRYSPEYDQTTTSGRFCVQFICFRKNPTGMKVLNWWYKACIDWCYDRFENGRFGDQKYLDDWPTRFPGVHVLRHLGGGVAPWNVQQFTFENVDGKVRGIHLTTKKKFDLVFYHFHCFKYSNSGHFGIIGKYFIDDNHYSQIYGPYVKSLLSVEKLLLDLNIHGDFHEALEVPLQAREVVDYYFDAGDYRIYHELYNESKCLIK